MPVFDRACDCGWYSDFSLEPSTPPVIPCPKCGGATYRAWRGKMANVIGDTYHVPLVDDVMTAERQVFQTKSEHRAAMKANGLIHRDRHAPMPGTDTDPHSTRWCEPPRYVTAEGEKLRLMEWQLHAVIEKGHYTSG